MAETPKKPKSRGPIPLLGDGAKNRNRRVSLPAESTMEFHPEFPIGDIVPREKETRYHSEDTRQVILDQLENFGWVAPIVLDADHNIVDGQYRYEIAYDQGFKTVPVIVSTGVSKENGTTDLFHMLGNRIVEWDKWNFAATDAVLKDLDGGLTTEKLLGHDVTSEKGKFREIAKRIGWFVNIVPKVLTGSSVTLEKLARLLTKQLAGKYHYDPAQLLFIESFREELENTRKEMIANGDVVGGVEMKLKKHQNEEADLMARSQKVAEEQGIELEYQWIDTDATESTPAEDVDSGVRAVEDGEVLGTAVFSADAEIQYVIEKVARLDRAGRIQVQTAADMRGLLKPQPDAKLMNLRQFKLMAHYFGDMTLQEAEDFYNLHSAETFNAKVEEIMANGRSIPAARSKNFPQNEEETRAELKRLAEEDAARIAKESSKSKKTGPKELTVAQLRKLISDNGAKPSGTKKQELQDQLRELGFDGYGEPLEKTADLADGEQQ